MQPKPSSDTTKRTEEHLDNNMDISGKDMLSMISMLENRISELEMEKTVKSKRPAHELSMKDIRDHVGRGSGLADIGLPFLSTAQGLHSSPTLATATHQTGATHPPKADGKMKSGFDLNNQFEVRREVRWPHAHIGPIRHLFLQAKADTITIEPFMYGFFMILNMDIGDKELRGRLAHGKQLMYHAALHGWASARRYHSAVLWAMEHENLDWHNSEQMMLLSMAAVQESSVPSRTTFNSPLATRKPPGSSDRQKSIICYLYNNDKHGCKFEKSAEGCKKLHACSLCADKGFYNGHTAFDCKK
jgi:hypothetical protein